ncbi:hypothetical protein B0A52_05341 [Exophiala mesophila]|uniref:Glucose-methanol-choline oxidoreductase N-terminal domain-containing protein n=1 Tax=Exophiala mesophila TaxID=212818 RepID=A0A438N4Y9_EXOME|nr:hypothetical protein B0A52_05341 [Exophiala mesophila]
MKHSFLLGLLLHTSLSWGRTLNSRSIINNANNQTFDFIVVGCGAAGLTVSARLSEDEDVSVLCLEAGELDQGEDQIQFPYYIGLQPPNFYVWGMHSVPQNQLNGEGRYVPVGRGVGGGTLINGLIWNRGNQDGYNAWNELGNDGWGWDDLLPYFKKSETYTPKIYNTSTLIEPHLQNSSVHGDSGPMHVSYPEYYWPQSDNYFEALLELDIPLSAEPNEGLEAGGYFVPLNIHPDEQIRWDARKGYYDPNANRTNFNVQVNSQVTKILFEDNEAEELRAHAVEYSAGRDEPVQTVFARQEVILAAGGLFSPKLLELSGIAAIEQSLTSDVTPNITNNAKRNSLNRELALGRQNLAELLHFLRSARSPTLETRTLDLHAPAQPDYLPSNYENETTLQNGYLAQLVSTINDLNQSYTPIFENLNDNAGGLHLALMRPLSRGTTHITSDDPFRVPAIDPRWLSHPFDFDTLILGLQLNQRILHTAPIQVLQPSYPDLDEDASEDQMAELIRNHVGTQFHYSGTAAMLPLSLGGVVSDELIVYGTQNLRVVDTSILPIVPGAHTQAVAFGVAEKAADIIKGQRVHPDTETDDDDDDDDDSEGGEDSGSLRLSIPAMTQTLVLTGMLGLWMLSSTVL